MHVGRALHPENIEAMGSDFIGDDTGDNISLLNNRYCELTALWWMWKNADAEYKGLVHYRRHFRTLDTSMMRAGDRFDRIATEADFRSLIANGAAVIVPNRRNYYIETIQSHWEHTLPVEQLEVTRRVLADLSPSSMGFFERVLSSRGAHMFNMMLMRSDLFDDYCSWLFPLLFELARRLNPDQYDSFNARYLGRVSELMLDVWLLSNEIRFREMVTVSPEPVNWTKKGSAFLAAKLFGKKYKKSF